MSKDKEKRGPRWLRRPESAPAQQHPDWSQDTLSPEDLDQITAVQNAIAQVKWPLTKQSLISSPPILVRTSYGRINGERSIGFLCQIPDYLGLDPSKIESLINFFITSPELLAAIRTATDCVHASFYIHPLREYPIKILDIHQEMATTKEESEHIWREFSRLLSQHEKHYVQDRIDKAAKAIDSFSTAAVESSVAYTRFWTMYHTVGALFSSFIPGASTYLPWEDQEKMINSLLEYWRLKQHVTLKQLKTQSTINAELVASIHEQLYPILELLNRFDAVTAGRLGREFEKAISQQGGEFSKLFHANTAIRDKWLRELG